VAELLSDLFASFELDLQASGRSSHTVDTYRHAVLGFSRWLVDQGLEPVDDELTRDRIRNWLAHLRDTRSQNTLATRHAGLSRFTKWRHAEGLADDDPMAGMPVPEWYEPPVPVLTDDQLAALVKTCTGRDFQSRRDEAIIRLLADCGPRIAELCGITAEEVDFAGKAIPILGKGRKPRMLYPSGFKTWQALDRYKRVRAQHRLHYLPDFWLGLRGPIRPAAVRQMLHARGEQIGVPDLHPHMLRHTKAHDHQLAGGNELNLQRQMGWTSSRMLKRYGASAADARAKDEAQRLRRGDRF